MPSRRKIKDHMTLQVAAVVAGGVALLFLRQILRRFGWHKAADDLG